MSPAATQFFDDIYVLLEPLWYELMFASFFIVGWCIVSRLSSAKVSPSTPRRKGKPQNAVDTEKLAETINACFAEGRKDEVVAAFRQAKANVAMEPELLRMVVWAMASESPSTLIDEVTKHFESHRHALCNSKSAVAVMDALATAARPDLMDEMMKVLSALQIGANFQVYESLMGGHAAAGDVDRVQAIISELHNMGQKLTARGHAFIIKGFLQRGMLEPALQQAQAMRAQGFFVPPFAMGHIFRVASQAGSCPQVFERMQASDVALPAEALDQILEDCAKRADAMLTAKCEALLYDVSNGKLSQASLGALLKAKAAIGDVGALDLFEEVQKSDFQFSDAYYVSLMAKCAEPKFLRFAEELARVLRAKGAMMTSTYSALMKVYAFCGLHGKACDLYDELLEKGLVPDAVTTTCLMRFAMEAGRTELLAKLSEKEPSSVQGYMLRIRSAGRNKDVDGAFAVLKQMKRAGLEVDGLACNCVLDACVCAGDLDRAKGLMAEMRTQNLLDTISFNTMLKLYCARGDMKGSQELFAQMQREGLKPDEVTYNCMINAAVSSGHLRLAWDMAGAMEKAGVPMDRFTISILLKAVKGQCSHGDVKSAMALLDKVGLDVCTSDGVLLNVALETCVKHRELRRLQNLVSAWEKSTLQPSTYTYAALIKSYSALQRVDRCKGLWKQMTEDRGTEPSDIVLGCMLDALVCNGMVTEAVALFRQWKVKVGANMIIYSTLIKGFAVAGRSQEAMEMWREIRGEGTAMNVVVYNALIDAQARAGTMKQAHELLSGMEEDGVAPDSITHSTMVKGYCTTGDLDKAFEIFRGTQKAGLASDCVVYNTLLDSCTKHNRVDLADKVLADFEANGVRASNFTLGILVKMYGRRRQLQKAFEVLSDFAPKHKLTPNMQVRSCLMSICINNGALDQALELFAIIKRDSERQVDARTLDNVLSGLVRANRLSEGVQFVEEAYGLKNKDARLLPPGQHLGGQGLERLLKSLSMRGLDAEATTMVSALHSKGVTLNGRLLGLALRS